MAAPKWGLWLHSKPSHMPTEGVTNGAWGWNAATWVGAEQGRAAAHSPFSSWKSVPFAESSPHHHHIAPPPGPMSLTLQAASRSL